MVRRIFPYLIALFGMRYDWQSDSYQVSKFGWWLARKAAALTTRGWK